MIKGTGSASAKSMFVPTGTAILPSSFAAGAPDFTSQQHFLPPFSSSCSAGLGALPAVAGTRHSSNWGLYGTPHIFGVSGLPMISCQD